MGLFNSISSIFRGRDAPTDRTSGSAYSFFMGGSTSGKRVNERTAMQMTAVYSCVRILSEAVAGLPLQFYRYTADGGKEKAVDHPLYFLLHDEPNPEMTSFVFRETLMTHLLLWGKQSAGWSEGNYCYGCTDCCGTGPGTDYHRKNHYGSGYDYDHCAKGCGCD